MTEEKKARHDSEYQSLLALFIALLSSFKSDNKEEALYALSELRTELTFNYVLDGLGMDLDEAMMLLKSSEDQNITQQDKDKRDRLIAAIKNLINFSVCEEYQLYDEVSDLLVMAKLMSTPMNMMSCWLFVRNITTIMLRLKIPTLNMPGRLQLYG